MMEKAGQKTPNPEPSMESFRRFCVLNEHTIIQNKQSANSLSDLKVLIEFGQYL